MIPATTPRIALHSGNRRGTQCAGASIAQTHVFAKRYQAELRDIFETESSVARDIAEHVDTVPVAEATRAAPLINPPGRRPPTQDLGAYDEYLQGRSHLGRVTPEAFDKARQHFAEAVARDPGFALAYDGLLGLYHKQLAYDWPEVETEMARALELSPTSPVVRERYAFNVLMPHARHEEAVAELALGWDPLSISVRSHLGAVRPITILAATSAVLQRYALACAVRRACLSQAVVVRTWPAPTMKLANQIEANGIHVPSGLVNIT
jgi:hypothetical protein